MNHAGTSSIQLAQGILCGRKFIEQHTCPYGSADQPGPARINQLHNFSYSHLASLAALNRAYATLKAAGLSSRVVLRQSFMTFNSIWYGAFSSSSRAGESTPGVGKLICSKKEAAVNLCCSNKQGVTCCQEPQYAFHARAVDCVTGTFCKHTVGTLTN